MNNPRPVETARAYLNADFVQSSRASSQFPGSGGGPFVTISRESGSGGSTLATALAERLARTKPDDEPVWSVFDQELIEQVLSDQQLSKKLARFIPEDRISEVESSVGEIVGLHPNLWALVQKTNDFMRALARKGHVILVGRGANFATASVRNGLHVRLVAPLEERARRMAARLRIPIAEAAAENKQTDAARRAYVRSVFNAEVAEPIAYDMVINTAQFTYAETADMLCARIRRKVPQAVA